MVNSQNFLQIRKFFQANSVFTQFSGLLDFCDHAANLGIVVVVAALSGDFERKVLCLFNFQASTFLNKALYVIFPYNCVNSHILYLKHQHKALVST